MRSQFLLDFSDAPYMKPNIHAASRDFGPANSCLLLASSQYLKDLVGVLSDLARLAVDDGDHPKKKTPDPSIPRSKGLSSKHPKGYRRSIPAKIEVLRHHHTMSG